MKYRYLPGDRLLLVLVIVILLVISVGSPTATSFPIEVDHD